MTNSYTSDCSAYTFSYGFGYFSAVNSTPNYTSVILFKGLNNADEYRHHILYGTSLNMHNENHINKVSLAVCGAQTPAFTIFSTGVLKVYKCNLIL